MVFLDRLLHADEPPQTRAALIEACHRSVFDESDAFYELLLEEPSALVRENLVYSLIRTERGLEGLRLGLEDEDLGGRQGAPRARPRAEKGAKGCPKAARGHPKCTPNR